MTIRRNETLELATQHGWTSNGPLPRTMFSRGDVQVRVWWEGSGRPSNPEALRVDWYGPGGNLHIENGAARAVGVFVRGWLSSERQQTGPEEPPHVDIPPAECHSCGETPAVVLSHEGHEFCDPCAVELSECDRCGELYEGESIELTDGNLWGPCCSEYAQQCTDCHQYAPYCNTINDEPVCDSCTSEYYSYCNNCGRYHHIDDEGMCDGCGYCEGRCCNCHRHSRLVRNYSYKPEPVFHGAGPLFMGLELEIECDNVSQTAQLVTERLGDLAYLKDDGSISCGFEIVTHPMSHEYAAQSFPWQLLDELKDMHAHGEDTGLHIHVNRDGFQRDKKGSREAHTYRWLKFFHRNQEHVQLVARRDSGEWAAWRTDDRSRALDYAKGGMYGAARYSAINVTNAATFEVRVFRSTVDRTELRAALDLVAASVEYTRQLRAADACKGGWEWPAFEGWLQDRSGVYCGLIEFINGRPDEFARAA